MSPPVTPHKAVTHKEAGTVKNSRFFEAYDLQTCSEESLQSLASKHDIAKSTAYNWL
jgi:hypothetical protein